MDLKESIYGRVLQAVLWGEPREAVFKIMEVNGIAGKEAEAIFRQAWCERVALLRRESILRMLKGLGIFAAAAGLFVGFWYGMGGITRGILSICILGTAWGGWWTLDGLIECLLAPTKKGSVLDND